MIDVDNLNTKLEGYFKLSFIKAMVDNLDARRWVYFELYFIMTDVVIYIKKFRGLF